MTTDQLLVPSDPSLRDLLELHKKDIFLSFSSHHIGIIQSFDATNQTAAVMIAYKKSFTRQNAVTGIPETVLQDYPVLIDCPVIVLGGATGSLTFKIQKGDECLLLFNDRAIDSWFQGNQNAQVPSLRLHSISDGIALVGVRSLPNVLSDYDTDRVVLKNDAAKIALSLTKIEISNASRNLNTLLQQLVSQIKDLVNATAAITVPPGSFTAPPSGGPVTGVSGTPVNSSTISAVASNLTTTATQIGELLE